MTRLLPRVAFASLVAAVAACSPPASVVNLSDLSPDERRSVGEVPVVPLGTPTPTELGEVSPIVGYACADSRVAAHAGALQQLRVKALQLRASIVLDVLVEPAGGWVCPFDYGAVAHGIAAAFWAVPPISY